MTKEILNYLSLLAFFLECTNSHDMVVHKYIFREAYSEMNNKTIDQIALNDIFCIFHIKN